MSFTADFTYTAQIASDYAQIHSDDQCMVDSCLNQIASKYNQNQLSYSNIPIDPLYTFPQVNYTTHIIANNAQGYLDFNTNNESLMSLTGDGYNPGNPQYNQGTAQNSKIFAYLGPW